MKTFTFVSFGSDLQKFVCELHHIQLENQKNASTINVCDSNNKKVFNHG
ncbi:hypothetical protein [Staphylococcus borealis]|nr:hypothetical protein [Staphylococcus borealis]NUI93311.1 hypothetical protein [Staphylococcus borealis]